MPQAPAHWWKWICNK